MRESMQQMLTIVSSDGCQWCAEGIILCMNLGALELGEAISSGAIEKNPWFSHAHAIFWLAMATLLVLPHGRS